MVLLIPAVQTKIVSQLTSRLSDDLEAEISIEKVTVLPYAGTKLSDFVILDQNNDSLFYAEKTVIRIEKIGLRKKDIIFSSINLTNVKTYLTEEEGKMNFHFLEKLFKSKKKESNKWGYKINGFKISDGDVKFLSPFFADNNFLKNDFLHFTNLSLKANLSINENDSISFVVSNFSFFEKTGVSIKGLKTNGYFANNNFFIERFSFFTEKSIFNIGNVNVQFEDDKKSINEFNVAVNKIVISPDEFQVFIPQFSEIDALFTFKGQLKGDAFSIRGRDVVTSFGKSTIVNTDFDITNYTNFKHSFLFVNLDSSKTTISDIEQLFPNSYNKLPSSVHSLGTMFYDGNITGFLDNLVAFGTLKTSIGTINTDLGVKFNENLNLIFSGGISTNHFNIGSLLPDDAYVGSVALDLQIEGERKSEKDFFVFMDGEISEFDFKNYHYQNVSVEGLLSNKKFDGQLKIDDRNGFLDFRGTVDWTKKVPNFNFSANLLNLHLDRLNILPKFEDSVISLNIESNVEGNNIDDLVGFLTLSDGILYSPISLLDFDEALVTVKKSNGDRVIKMESPFFDFEVVGETELTKLKYDLLYHMAKYTPTFVASKTNNQKFVEGNNNFSYKIILKSAKEVFLPFFSNIEFPETGIISGVFSSENKSAELEAAVDAFKFKNIDIDDLNLKLFSSDINVTEVALRTSNVIINNFISMPNMSIHQKVRNDTISSNLFWNNWDNITNSGSIYTESYIQKHNENQLAAKVLLKPSMVILEDSVWNFDKATFYFSPEETAIDSFKVSRNSQFIFANGVIHKTEADSLGIEFNHINLSHFFKENQRLKVSFGGLINGKLSVKNLYRDPLLTTNITIDDFIFNNDVLGDFYLRSLWDNDSKALAVLTRLNKNGKQRMRGGGFFYPAERKIDLKAKVDSVSIAFLAPFVDVALQNFEGMASGAINYKGVFPKAYLTGNLNVVEASFDVDMLNTSYYVKDSVFLFQNEIRFDNMSVADRYNQKGSFQGSIYHKAGYKDLDFDLKIAGNNMLFLNTTQQNNPYYYGTVFGDGNMQVKGPSKNLDIIIKGNTKSKTRLFIPMETAESVGKSNFIHFANAYDDYQIKHTDINKDNTYKVDLSGVKLDMDIEVTPESEVQIIFDERLGDILKGRGNGNMQLRINRQGEIKLYGDYQIYDGEYLFSLQNLINKKFDIVRGGTLKWDGDPVNAEIDIKTIYRLKASLSDLLGEVNSLQQGSDFQRRVQIHTSLLLTGMLQQPNIKLGIEFPTLDESRSSLLLDYIATEEDMNKQVFSLLVLNKFYTPEYMRGEHSSENYNSTALLTTTEMLFAQINKWMSAMSNDFDFGVAYRPGDNITSEEFEFAMSTQVFNNRVSLNGNVGVGKYQANTSTMIGDFDVDVKLNRSGTIRAKAYTRTNEDYLYESSPTTQGVGISFNEDFNKFGELLRKYWKIVTFRRSDDDDHKKL